MGIKERIQLYLTARREALADLAQQEREASAKQVVPNFHPILTFFRVLFDVDNRLLSRSTTRYPSPSEIILNKDNLLRKEAVKDQKKFS